MPKYTICTGNPKDGYQLFGVWDSETDAIEAANKDASLDEPWWVLPIQPHELSSYVEELPIWDGKAAGGGTFERGE